MKNSKKTISLDIQIYRKSDYSQDEINALESEFKKHFNQSDMTKAKDTTKLIKKTIINKLGKQQTVYVKMMDEKKEGWLDKFSGLFGFKQRSEAMKKLETDYKQNGIGEKFGLTWDGWKDHVAEYMKNKDNGQSFLTRASLKRQRKQKRNPLIKSLRRRKASLQRLSCQL